MLKSSVADAWNDGCDYSIANATDGTVLFSGSKVDAGNEEDVAWVCLANGDYTLTVTDDCKKSSSVAMSINSEDGERLFCEEPPCEDAFTADDGQFKYAPSVAPTLPPTWNPTHPPTPHPTITSAQRRDRRESGIPGGTQSQGLDVSCASRT